MNTSWNPEAGPKIGPAWHAIRDHLANHGRTDEVTLVAIATHAAGIVDKTAHNLLRDLNHAGYLRRVCKGVYELRLDPHNVPVSAASPPPGTESPEDQQRALARDVEAEPVMSIDTAALRAEFDVCGACDYGADVGCSCSIRDPRLVIVALCDEVDRLTAVLDGVRALHRPWYEINGVRHDHRIPVCGDAVPADHVCIDLCLPHGDTEDPEDAEHEVLACYECRWPTDEGEAGYLLWPCATARALGPSPSRPTTTTGGQS